MNISIVFPSETPGAVIDCKKGRAIIPFTARELEFVANMYSLIAVTQMSEPVQEHVHTPAAPTSHLTIDTTAEVVQ